MKTIKQLILYFFLLCTLTGQAQWDLDIGGFLHNDTTYGYNPNYVCDYTINDSELYIVGATQYIDTLTINNISKRTNNEWFKLGNGAESAIVYSTEYYHNKLYIGGLFMYIDWDHQGTHNFAVWDGIDWSGPPGGYTLGQVYDFFNYHDTLFIAQGTTHGVLAFNGTDFLDMGYIGNNWTRSIEVFNGELYAGGYHGLWKYLGNFQWQYLNATGPQGHVYDMCVDTINNFLYCGGAFDYVGDTMKSSDVAMWDGFQWHSMGYALSCDVYWYHPMAMYRGNLYVGWCGDTMHTGLVSKGFTRWDGNQWHSIEGGNPDGGVYALNVYKDTLWVGGDFDTINNQRTCGLAKYYLPDTGCTFLQSLVQSYADTFYLPQGGGTVDVPLYNNNAYAGSWLWDFDDASTDTVKDPLHTYSQIGTYHVSVTVTENGCTKTATKDFVILESTGINDIALKDVQFRVYPNPANKKLTIEITNPQIIVTSLQIVDIAGKNVKNITSLNKKNNYTVNIEDVPAGLYFVKLQTTEGTVVKKVVVE